MKTFRLQVDTYHKEELIDITKEIRNFVKESGVESGYLILFVPHTTAGITINENTDPDVQTDVIKGLRDVFPNREDYLHFEKNSDAHLKSSVIGVSEMVLIENNDLALGVWQGLYFCEFDGPKSRKVWIKIFTD
ncbi:MAG: secondary thiamine-phosphate synthase enzyme YjbQ [Candidatus Izemoplasmataceae bacterium]